jgi:dihydrofolate synthase/folylpolyglutamate synthase
VDISLSSYKDALDYLFARTTGGFKFGLERTRDLLHVLGDPHLAYPVLHVAGTNGKGSSVATAEALLEAKGLRVARYTSPHLVDFRERMVVAGEKIESEAVTDFIARWTPLVERIGASFFEATTAMAFDFFARRHADVALIEAGLGGRLDSTNVVEPVAAGVISIGFDHTEYLGDTLEQIAFEKAGIYKPGRPAVIGETDAVVRAVLAREAERRAAAPVRVVADECRLEDIEVSDDGTAVTIEAFGERRRLRTPLVGCHQAANLAFTLVLLDAAGAPYRTALVEAERHLPLVRIPGRFQHVGKFVFDVAHNPDGAAVVAQTLESVAPPRPITALLSVLRDKDWRRMMQALAGVVDHFVLTNTPTAPASRAWQLTAVVDFARAEGLSAEAIPDFDQALARVEGVEGTVLVTGSFHTVGDAMARLQVSPLPR